MSFRNKRKREQNSNEDNKRIKPENEFIKKIQKQPGVRGKLVFVYSENENPFTILQVSADSEGFPLAIKAPNSQFPKMHELSINNEVIAKGEFQKLADARKELSRLALKNLQYTCFSVIRKQSAAEIDKVQVTPAVFDKSTPSNEGKFDCNSETVKSSIGARMMRLMGWSGGGLGSQEQGDKNLVMSSGQMDRRGLGQILPQEIKALLEEYAHNDDIDSIAFSDQFTKEQRALIHSLANRYNLRSKSYGKEENRMLVIRKKLKPWQMVHFLLENGKETAEYKLILPLNEEDDE